MTARTRVCAAVALLAVAAAGLVVSVTTLTDHGAASAASTSESKGRPGTPPFILDLGLRDDAEARALRRAATLLDDGKRAQAGAIFRRYSSLQARMGAAYAAWDGPASLARVDALARENPRSAFAKLHLGLARLWAGRSNAEAAVALRAAGRVQPDTASAVFASDLLHSGTPRGLPTFFPNFPSPAAIDRIRPVSAQYAALERAAQKPDVHAKILWGVALQHLGRPISAEREFAAAAKLAPNDPEAQTAAAVGRFTKDDPARAFAQLGPLSRRFPRAATVRFHLGLLLIYIRDFDDAKKQLTLAANQVSDTGLAREAKKLLAPLEKQ